MMLTETMLQDLRYGVRILFRNAGFTLIAVIALAIGIGVNTAVFTAYKAMVARPLDARDPGAMVNLALVRESGAANFTFSYPDYEAYRDSIHSFSGLLAFQPERMTLSSGRTSAPDSEPGQSGPTSARRNVEFASVFAVSENYFKVLGVAAMRGRTFDSMSVPQLLASPSVLISENYWQARFAGDPAVLGKTIVLNGISVAIIGITPHNFVGTSVVAPDFWLPLSLEPLVHADAKWLSDRENLTFRLFARLAPGVGIRQAEAEVAVLADHLRTLHDPRSVAAKPSTVIIWRGSPFPLPLYFYSGLNLTIVLVMVAAGMVLAVACANVSSLQLARARSRHNELCTRLALGASRLRVIRQLLTESILMGLLAGTVALFLTWAFLQILVMLAARIVPIEYGTLIFHVTPDLKIFAFVLSISLVAGILFGLAPAIESSRSALSLAIKAGTSPVRTRRLQNYLIGAQVALSLAILIAAGMLIRGAMNVLKMDTGYESKQIVDLDLEFPQGPKYAAEHKLALVHELRTRLGALPGVSAITSAKAPDDVPYVTAAVSLDAKKSASQNVQSILYYTYVEPNYFQTLNIPLLLGRDFQAQAGEPEHVVILSESAARQLWPGQSPVSHRLRLGPINERPHNRNDLVADGAAYEVIGVARDTRGFEFDGSDSRKLYLPLPEDKLVGRPILLRTESDPAQMTRILDSVVSSVDPDVVTTSSTLADRLWRSAPFFTSSLAAAVASSVGLLGLLLAAMGIYGTVSYIVVMRTREIGIRMAIGAQRRNILGLIMRESTRPVVAGLLVGTFLAVGVTHLLRNALYRVNPIDGVAFVAVPMLFLAIALLAAYPPSRRAMRVDPVVALRYE